MYGVATVAVEGSGKLRFTRGEMIADLDDWNYDTFRATWAAGIVDRSLLTFTLNTSGGVSGIVMDLAGDSVIFHRAPDATDSTKHVSR